MARPARSPERSGPHDADDVDPALNGAPGIVDFGAVRVPVPERGTITVEPVENGRMQAVHISLPEGRLSVSALAAPKSSRLWPDLAKEIDASLREGGARVRSFQGEWGRELHATSGAATSVFVGVDGARWMLYGVATGPTCDAAPLLEELRRMVRGTIVVRGRSPYPVRTVLPLEPPGHLVDEASDPAIGSTPTVVVRAVAPAAVPALPEEDGRVAVAHAAPAAGLPPSVDRVRPAAGPSRSFDAVRDPEDRPTDVWPDGLLPGSRGHGHVRPAAPPAGGRRRSAGPLRPPLVPVDRSRTAPPTVVSPTAGTTAVPAVLRRGRHAAPEIQEAGPSSPGPGGGSWAARSGPGAPRRGPAPRPPAAAVPWGAARPGPNTTDPVTEPLPRSPAPRPSGRHRRPD